eukprot:571303-Pyramimonas_sp.AAC.1
MTEDAQRCQQRGLEDAPEFPVGELKHALRKMRCLTCQDEYSSGVEMLECASGTILRLVLG